MFLVTILTGPHVQVCGLPQCSDFNLWLYVVLPAAVALVLVAVILAVCCLRQSSHKKPLSVATSSPRYAADIF